MISSGKRAVGSKEPKRGKGSFQWNAGGWFGGQIGGTIWMLLAGSLVLYQGSWLGAVILLFFLLPNVIGSLMWYRRDHISPYPAVQALMAVVGLFSLLTLAAFDVSGRFPGPGPHSQGSPRSLYWIMVIFPATMIMFHLQNRSGGKKRNGPR